VAEGFAVLAAMDGKVAYRILQTEEEVVLAIVDGMMPYINGTELVRFMQTDERLKKIPVIMMTAEQSPKLPSESFAAGAVAFLPKPFTNMQMRTMLRTFGQRAGSSSTR
jgi:two-component system cell cycle response regulator